MRKPLEVMTIAEKLGTAIWAEFFIGHKTNEVIGRVLEGEYRGKLVLPTQRGSDEFHTYLDCLAIVGIEFPRDNCVLARHTELVAFRGSGGYGVGSEYVPVYAARTLEEAKDLHNAQCMALAAECQARSDASDRLRDMVRQARPYEPANA